MNTRPHLEGSPIAHTPGPWRVLPHELVDIQIAGPAEHVHHAAHEVAIVRNLWKCDGGLGRSRANARLIAAAPDLLKALNALCSAIDGPGLTTDNCVEEVEAARRLIRAVENNQSAQ